ncbi:T9SS type A sorting domain-containing protein [Crocinitomix sp.]|nr:T9SS type A sorting domain-containing protein [Crocinitomix sp.]
MKKVYLLVSGLLLTAGVANAQQTAVQNKAELNTAPFVKNGHGSIGINADRAADDIIWEDGFDDAGVWTAEGPSGDYEVSGWSIGATTNGWYFGTGDDMGTDGDFARFVNGDPIADPAPIEDGPFTLTYDMPIDLTGIPAPHVEFEQYGARFFTVQAVQISTDGGSSWVTVGTNDDITPLTDGGGDVFGQPETRRYNMTAALDGATSILIRLFWDGAMNGPEMNYVDYAWFVDNIRIVEGHSYDMEIQTAYFRAGVGYSTAQGMEYYQIPLAQAEGMDIEFAGEAINQGGSTFTGAYLSATVNMGGEVFSGTSDMFDIAPSEGDSLITTTTYTPDAMGTYDISWMFLGDNPDTYNVNDELTDEFEVTDVVYARDNDNEAGSISNVTGNLNAPLLIGNTMDFFADATVGYIDVAISDAATNVDQLIFAQIMVLDGDGNFNYVDQTPDHVITSGDNGGFIRLAFDSPVELAAGESILLLAGHYGGSEEVEFSTAQSTDNFTVLGYTSGETTPFWLSNPRVVMIRAITTDEGIGINEVATTNFAIGQNMPNPFNDNSLINYDLNEAANVTVEIVDVTGKIVKTINQGTQDAGTYTLNLDANDFAGGLYYYTFTVGTEQVTKSMVITK